MKENHSLGGCLFHILFLLIILAIFGIVDWSSVGNWLYFMLAILLGGYIFLGIILFYGWLTDEERKEDEKTEDVQPTNESKSNTFKWLFIIGGILIIGGIISSQEETNTDFRPSPKNQVVQEESKKSSRDNTNEERSNSTFEPTLINKTVVSTDSVYLYPKNNLDSYPTHFLKMNARVKVVDETKNSIQIETNRNKKFWAKKDNFEIYTEKEGSINSDNNQKLEPISEFGNVVIDSIAVRKEPDIFGEKAFKLRKGERVYILGKIPETIYLMIRVRDDYYYVMENAIDW